MIFYSDGRSKRQQIALISGTTLTSNQKVAIVTGGSSGIGRATAIGLAKEEGAKVMTAARREKEGTTNQRRWR